MSTVKVNTVDKRTGSTLTLGGCGTTVTLGAGATQSGFGRTGTVDWCTTAKTAPFTGVSGKGYFVNTSCGAVTVTLPASPSAGDIISVADYASTWQTNAVTLCRNSSKINGICSNVSLETEGQSITLVYVDSTRGWKNTMDSTSNVTGFNGISATGGTITCCGSYRIHTFTSSGTFCVSSLSPNPIYNKVDYLVVAGGAGGGFAGARGAGGGGAGGFRESYCSTTSGTYTASPLASCTSLPVTATAYPITVGAGGAPSIPAPPYKGGCGSSSIFSTITSTGGGGGGGEPSPNTGLPGASGGGGGSTGSGTYPGGTGNTPPTSPPQGTTGGNGSADGAGNPSAGGGGGGAGVAGTNASPGNSGAGGNGSTTSISGTPTAYAGGGGGGGGNSFGLGGSGGGGSGGAYLPPQGCVSAGTANTGGGGGGCSNNAGGKAGGSGIVIIRYRYQ
jgi:hypothetical protein